MGVVWKARHLRLNRLVALKLVRFASAGDGPERDRFRREGEAVARVRHPHIIEIYDADEADGQPYIAMELLEGGTLARRMRDRPLPPREAAELVKTLARAVQAAHDAGVVHRDLKPTNVLFTADGTPKVADFGLAKLLDAETGQTRTGDVLGTPSYMAPEQARGEVDRIGPRTDVYGLGVVLYEMLHGKPPFRGPNRRTILAKVLHGRPEGCAATNQEDRWGLTAICLKCLEKEPNDRYPSAAALAENLERWLEGGKPEAKRPGPLRRAARLMGRRSFLVASLGGCGLAAAGWAGWQFSRPDPDAALKEIERRLAHGETVELLSSGPTSAPAWSHEVRGTNVTDRSEKDQAFRLQSFSDCWLELLRDPQTDRYRIDAEMRHEASELSAGVVGLFFGGRVYSTAAGDFRIFLKLAFNEVYSDADLIRHQNEDRKAAAPVPSGNPVTVTAQLYGAGNEWGRGDSLEIVAKDLFQPKSPVPWRSLGLRMTPEKVSVSWEGQEQPDLSFPPYRVAEMIEETLAKFNLPNPLSAPNVPTFNPRGSFGLYVDHGAASFRNIRIEPLRSTD
jgi:serine/threonine-protein kinase